jgi:hypothetical protein
MLDTGNSYFDLRKRIFQKIKTSKADEQIMEIAQKAYEDAVKSENIVISRVERERLFISVLQLLWNDINKNVDGK